jgi:DNA primase
MIADTQQVKERIDCRDLVARDLGKPKVKSSGYHAYPCPLHHEVKGASLVVYADGWTCHGKCNRSGDAITWLEAYHGMDFKQAVIALGGNLADVPVRSPDRLHRPEPEPSAEPPAPEWQHHAHQIAQRAQQYLWSDSGIQALAYLRRRGLSDATIEQAQLGYVPPRSDDDVKYGRVFYPDWKKADGKPVRVPCGHTIPHFAEGHIWALRVRTVSGQPKYSAVSGGSKALYWADHITLHRNILITEGEFDALIAHQLICDIVSPVALASASNHSFGLRWSSHLVTARVLLARMDSDSAGMKALAKLAHLSRRIKSIRVPQGKDINDYYLACLRYPTPPAAERFAAWINTSLEQE